MKVFVLAALLAALTPALALAERIVTLKSVYSGQFLSANTSGGAMTASSSNANSDNAKWVLEFIEPGDSLYSFGNPRFRLKNVATQAYVRVPSGSGSQLEADGNGTSLNDVFRLEHNYQARTQFKSVGRNRPISINGSNQAQSQSSANNGVQAAFEMKTVSTPGGINIISGGNRYSQDEYLTSTLDVTMEYFISQGLSDIAIRVIWSAIQTGVDWDTDTNEYADTFDPNNSYSDGVGNTKRMLEYAKKYGFHTMLDFHTLWPNGNYTYPDFLLESKPYDGGNRSTNATPDQMDQLVTNPVIYYSIVQNRDIKLREIYNNMVGDIIGVMRDYVDYVAIYNEPQNYNANFNNNRKDEFNWTFKLTADRARSALYGTHQQVGLRFSGGWNPWSTVSGRRFNKQLWNGSTLVFDLLNDLDFLGFNFYYLTQNIYDSKFGAQWPLDLFSDPDVTNGSAEMWITEANHHIDNGFDPDVAKQDEFYYGLFQRVEDFEVFSNVFLWSWTSHQADPGKAPLNVREGPTTGTQQVGNYAFDNFKVYLDDNIPDSQQEWELPSTWNGAVFWDRSSASRGRVAELKNNVGDWIESNVIHVDSSGSYDLVFFYINPGSASTFDISVNGSGQGTVSFSATGWTDNYATAIKDVILNAGFNTVRVTKSGAGRVILDEMIWVAAGGGSGGSNTIVGGSANNGNFNGTSSSSNTFSALDNWQNIGTGGQSIWGSETNKDYDGTRNAFLNFNTQPSDSPAHGLDTGYDLQSGDSFDVSYYWRDEWNWNDSSDKIKITLYTTSNDQIDGSWDSWGFALSGTSNQNNQYQQETHNGIFTAGSGDVGKRLFVRIQPDTGTTNSSYARLDNFVLEKN